MSMLQDSDISAITSGGQFGHPPHAKYEKLISLAKEVPPATTVVAHLCDEMFSRIGRFAFRRHSRLCRGRIRPRSRICGTSPYPESERQDRDRQPNNEYTDNRNRQKCCGRHGCQD
jgi:hypothetical protein